MAEDREPKASIPEEDASDMSEEEIDRNLEETFPASDPPSWTLGTNHAKKSPSDDEE
jgi:hypothetical protein